MLAVIVLPVTKSVKVYWDHSVHTSVFPCVQAFFKRCLLSCEKIGLLLLQYAVCHGIAFKVLVSYFPWKLSMPAIVDSVVTCDRFFFFFNWTVTALSEIFKNEELVQQDTGSKA